MLAQQSKGAGTTGWLKFVQDMNIRCIKLKSGTQFSHKRTFILLTVDKSIGRLCLSTEGTGNCWPFRSRLCRVSSLFFINDLFFQVKTAKLNAYADDHQIYYSHVDPATLDACVSHNVKVANHWYHENGMLVNESKHQGLVLGDTDYSFSFPVKDTLEIFGMEIDNKLDFSSHVSNLCKRINNQFNVMLRFRKLIPRDTLLKKEVKSFSGKKFWKNYELSTDWTAAFNG